MSEIITAKFNTLNTQEYRALLNKSRAAAIKALWTPAEIARIRRLESLYGKYLFLPLDLPQPVAKPSFANWWNTYSKPVNKIKADITEQSRTTDLNKDSRGVYGGDEIFNSINSPTSINNIFEANVRDDAPDHVANLDEFVDSLKTSRKSYNFWSSNRQINYHRDTGPWLDLPVMFRAMVYDTNPSSTFSIVESPTDVPYAPSELSKHTKTIPRVPGCVTFGVNNVRAEHGSYYHHGYTKCILICNTSRFDLDAYEDLMERSIKKYGEFAIISDLPSSRFYH